MVIRYGHYRHPRLIKTVTNVIRFGEFRPIFGGLRFNVEKCMIIIPSFS